MIRLRIYRHETEKVRVETVATHFESQARKQPTPLDNTETARNDVLRGFHNLLRRFLSRLLIQIHRGLPYA
jgi:hypothetical protein